MFSSRVYLLLCFMFYLLRSSSQQLSPYILLGSLSSLRFFAVTLRRLAVCLWEANRFPSYSMLPPPPFFRPSHSFHCRFNRDVGRAGCLIEAARSFLFAVCPSARRPHKEQEGQGHPCAQPFSIECTGIRPSTCAMCQRVAAMNEQRASRPFQCAICWVGKWQAQCAHLPTPLALSVWRPARQYAPSANLVTM